MGNETKGVAHKCENCRFYDIGKCCRFPPAIIGIDPYGQRIVEFPDVLSFMWCGEWVALMELKRKLT